jgi:ankyrin repeat protein
MAPKREHEKEMKDLSDIIMSSINETARDLSSQSVDDDAAELLKDIEIPKTLKGHVETLRKLIATTGTDVEQNDRDPYGDGDQRPIRTETKCQVFRNIWEDGGDIATLLSVRGLSPFAMDCVQGNKKAVLKKLENASPGLRAKLLERRESCFRAPPMILVLANAKHPQVVQQVTGTLMSQMDHLGVAKALLQYGARPDAKDVAGKTAVHWGAGAVSNDITRTIAEYCIAAARTSHAYGKTVTLDELSKQEYNGLCGTLGGYIVDKDRRVVHVEVDGEPKELSLLPKNIFLEGKSIIKKDYNLVDIQDRTGSVALHEVIMGGGVESASFLCNKHNASVDVAENNGVTPRLLANSPIGGLGSPAMDVIKKHANRQKSAMNKCNKCKKREKVEYSFSRCSRCQKVFYCSRDCQVADWNEHRLHCREGTTVTLSKDCVMENAMSNNKGVYGGGGYRRPRGKNVGEKFFIKVQNTSRPEGPLAVYDKTRTCQFQYKQGPGHQELYDKVCAEKNSCGRKTHFQASFDTNGNLKVFVDTAELLEW